jgi:integrase/recombinase XerD
VTAYAVDPTRDQRYKQAVAFPECSAWQTAIELDGLAERTRLDYLRSVSAFLVAYNTTPQEWTHLDVNAFLASYPAGSRGKVRAHMGSFFRWLEDEDIIDRSPMRRVRRPKPTAQKVPDIFGEGEIAAMSQDPLLALMLHTGLRKGECRRLQRRHVNLDRAELRVLNGKGGKDRVVPPLGI